MAWNFITALLALPGVNVLIATERHANVANEVFAELPHLAGNILPTRTPPSSCVSMELNKSARAMQIFTNFRFST